MTRRREAHRSGAPYAADLLELVGAMAPHEHLCLIHETSGERLAGVLPFLAAGLDLGQRCVYLGEAGTASQVLDALRTQRPDAGSAELSDALLSISVREDVAGEPRRAPENIVAWLTEASHSAAAVGFAALRVAADMG